MTAPPDDTTTDASAIIAALRTERDAALAREAALAEELAARTAELAERNTEYGERNEQLAGTVGDAEALTVENQELRAAQAAGIEVLQAMIASPGDTQPVFDLIAREAAKLCEVPIAVVAMFDGRMVHLVAQSGFDAAYANVFAKQFPRSPSPDFAMGRAIVNRRVEQIEDTGADTRRGFIPPPGAGSALAVPLLRHGAPLGVIAVGRRVRGPYSRNQIALLQTFAEQAVIAITSAETYRALETRTSDLQASLKYQTATSDVLKVISRSTFDLQPALETLLVTAARLCGADLGTISLREGDAFRVAAPYSLTPEYAAFFRGRLLPLDRGSVTGRTALEGRIIHVADLMADPEFALTQVIKRRETALGVPLLRDGAVIGVIVLVRQQVQPFTDRQIELVSTFADQAVIAIENARLLNEQREALEQQTATAEVLQVINASPGDLQPVFDTILDNAMRRCDAASGCMYTYDGNRFPIAAMRGVPDALADFITTQPPLLPSPGGKIEQVLTTKRPVQILDLAADDMYLTGDVDTHAYVDLGGARTIVDWPLIREGSVVGLIAIYRQQVRAFSEKEIALLENFAAQAVIAMESARLLNELRARTEELAQRQAELRVTFENMGDGVAMFDETQHLVSWNRKFQDILDVPDDIIARRRTFSEYVRYLAERGEYDAGIDPEEHVRHLIEQAGQSRTYERTRPDGRIIEIRHNPVAGGGFVLIYADITERKRNEAEIRAARDAAEEASRAIEAAYRELKTAQANLIQAEKMASLGQLTAGIAHEIKNPLNFVNNFAALSVDLLSELKETAAPGFAALSEAQRAEIDDVSAMLTSNLEKITEHGKRADGIVKAMLEHSRGSSGERRMVNLNALIDEALNLAYHGARAQDQSFNITLERDFGAGIAPIEVNPQDITRVFLNIFSNGFYAATRRTRNGGDAGFEPTLKVATIDAGEGVDIRVRDNGTGIPADIRDKLFQPFFTTKPTGEGTGLGLSITYDIVTQQHGGAITVDSEVGQYSEFTIRLPRNP